MPIFSQTCFFLLACTTLWAFILPSVCSAFVVVEPCWYSNSHGSITSCSDSCFSHLSPLASRNDDGEDFEVLKLLKSMKGDIKATKDEIIFLKENMATKDDIKAMKGDITILKKQVGSLQNSVGSLTEDSIRVKAAKMFGESFAKPFLIRSLHDAVHLVTKANYAPLLPDAAEVRMEAAKKLAHKAKTLAIPLAEVFLSYMKESFKDTKNSAHQEQLQEAASLFDPSREDRNIEEGLGRLLGLVRSVRDEDPPSVILEAGIAFYLTNLKEAFEENDVIDSKLLACDGPGVMLMELVSRYDNPGSLKSHPPSDVVTSIQEEIQMDLRGSINLTSPEKNKQGKALHNGHATITVGEAKASLSGRAKAREQVRVRTNFMKAVVDTIFPKDFGTFVCVGRIFVPASADSKDLVNDGINDGVSIYFHRV